jgi:predicted RNA-binding Zn ribbon-like protein
MKGTGTVPPPAPGEAESVALALANTMLAGEVDQLDGPDEVTAWAAGHELGTLAAVAGADLAALAGLRAAIRELFTAAADGRAPEAGAVGEVNAAARLALGAPVLLWAAAPRLDWQAEHPGTVANAIARIARDAIEVLCGPNGQVIHQCEAHGCDRLFFRTHGRRRWCSNACGDRVRVARYYRVRKARLRPPAFGGTPTPSGEAASPSR